MIASVINAVLILVGSLLGLLLKNRLSENLSQTLIYGLSICVMVIGITCAIETENILSVIICLIVGTVIGELLQIERGVNILGEKLKAKVAKNSANSRFTEGFVTATLLFCVGSMAIVGSMEAGMNHNYSILLSKSIIDAVIAVSFAATMGFGVCFSGIAVFIYQGALTLLAIFFGPMLPEAVITEMTAVGGILLIGVALNMLGVLGEIHIRVANMLPSIFIAIGYVPLANWLSNLI